MILRSGGQVYSPSGPEAILWHCGLWFICTARELKDIYENQVAQSHLYPEISFEWYLNHLEENGLIASGQAETMEEALYDLVKDLFIEVPRAAPLLLKVTVFLQSVFAGAPIRVARRVFQRPSYQGFTGKILRAASSNTLTTAELVRWSSKDKELSRDFHDSICNEGDTLTGIEASSRLIPAQKKVVQAVAKLYLDREIMFERKGIEK